MTNHWLYPITEFLLSCFKFPGGWLQQCTSTILRQEFRCRDKLIIHGGVITGNHCWFTVVLALGQDVNSTVRYLQSMSTAYHRHSHNYMSHIHTFLPFSWMSSWLDWSAVTYWVAGVELRSNSCQTSSTVPKLTSEQTSICWSIFRF